MEGTTNFCICDDLRGEREKHDCGIMRRRSQEGGRRQKCTTSATFQKKKKKNVSAAFSGSNLRAGKTRGMRWRRRRQKFLLSTGGLTSKMRKIGWGRVGVALEEGKGKNWYHEEGREGERGGTSMSQISPRRRGKMRYDICRHLCKNIANICEQHSKHCFFALSTKDQVTREKKICKNRPFPHFSTFSLVRAFCLGVDGNFCSAAPLLALMCAVRTKKEEEKKNVPGASIINLPLLFLPILYSIIGETLVLSIAKKTLVRTRSFLPPSLLSPLTLPPRRTCVHCR